MKTITISSTTQLVLSDDNDGSTLTYAEMQHGWETGNFVTVASSCSPADVIAAYAC